MKHTVIETRGMEQRFRAVFWWLEGGGGGMGNMFVVPNWTEFRSCTNRTFRDAEVEKTVFGKEVFLFQWVGVLSVLTLSHRASCCASLF